MNETGIPTVTQKATRLLRNRKSTAMTRTRPDAPFLSSSMVRSRINSQDSSYANTSTSGGHWPRFFSSHSCSVRAASRLSDDPARLNIMLTAGRPSRVVRISPLRARRSTVATSPSVRRRPSSPERSARRSKPLSSRCCSSARSCLEASSRPTLPAGRSTLRVEIRCAMSASDMSSSRSAALGTWIAISSRCRPTMSILAIPRASRSRSI